MKPPWDVVEAQLLDQVFYRWSPEEVRDVADLPGGGYVDSLTVVAALEVLVLASGNDAALDSALAEDFVSLDAMRALYARL